MYSKGKSHSFLKLESVADNFPIWVAIYFLATVAIRLLISPNLNLDEAQMAGATDFQLYYSNSHPPLYNWIFRCFLELTGWNWALSAATLKYSLIFGIFYLAWDATKRITGNTVLAMLVSCCFIFFPQIIWESQSRLTHSVLVAFGSVALIHATVRIHTSGKWYDFLWMGIAAAAGCLAKFNFFILLASLIFAISTTPPIRKSFNRIATLLSIGVYLAICAPVLYYFLTNLNRTSERMKKLYSGYGDLTKIDIPYIGLDGFLHLIINIFAWAFPLMLAAIALYAFKAIPDRPTRQTLTEEYEIYIPFFRKLVFGALLIFSTIVLLGDMHNIKTRYLTPLLMPLPFWLILEFPIIANRNATTAFLRASVIIAFLISTGLHIMYLLPSHIFSHPYKEFAENLTEKFGSDIRFANSRYKYIANLQPHIDKTRNPYADSNTKRYISVWMNREKHRPPLKGYVPVGKTYTQKHNYYYFSDKKAVFHAQVYEKVERTVSQTLSTE